MILCTILICFVVLLAILKIGKEYRTVWMYTETFPGPVAYPFVGNLLQLGLSPSEYLETLYKWARQYNWQMYRIWAAGQHYVMLSHPNDIEAVLSSTTLLYKTDVYKFLRPWLGDGLLTSFGPKWHKRRKLITPSFHFQILLEFLSVMNNTIDTFLEKVSAVGGIVDVQPLVHRLTLDIICETAMGVKINSLQEDSDILYAINDLCLVIHDRVFSPIKRFDGLFYFTPQYWLQKRSLNVLRKRLHSIIIKRRELLDLDSGRIPIAGDDYKRPKKAFLDNLLTARVDGRPLTFDEIFEEVSTFMFEGHDTTGSAICFSLYTLSRHPEVQAKVFNEQKSLFGSEVNRNPTYQEIQDMKYLELVIKETLRLYPSVPIIARTNTEMIEINKRKIPQNTTIVMLLGAMAFNEEYFTKPSELIPERYLATNREGANPFDSVPFSAGPRNCIGQKFAMMELKATVSKVVRHFQILPPCEGLGKGIHDLTLPGVCNRTEFDPRLGAIVTLKSENGIYVRLKPRTYQKT